MRDNVERSRFEIEEQGHLAFADYRRRGPSLVITHVEAAPPLRGTGAAGRLMQEVADLARREGLKIVPLCGYASAWLKRHRDYGDLVA